MKEKQTKTCPKCGRELPISEFYYQASRGTYTSWCKDCYRDREKSQEYRQKKHEQYVKKVIREVSNITPETNTMTRNTTEEQSLNELITQVKKHRDFNLKDFFTPRELINALYDFGYRGELSIMVEQKVRLSHE